MMKNKIKSGIITSAMIASMLIPNTTAFASTTFTDVKQSDWYYSTVTKLADTGIINGTGDGSFNPTGEVGIDSFIKMIVMARGMEVGTETTDYWAEPYLQTAYKNGFEDVMYYNLILRPNSETGFSNKLSFTTRNITREQMAALIAKALELDNVSTDTTHFNTTAYSDFSEISKDYNTAVRSVIINGIMGGKDGGIFDPQGTVTRAEAATVIARYLYPEERLTYNYTQNEEKHNIGDVYIDNNTWIVPTEVKVYETGQAIPTVSEVSMVYVEELGKYIYAGMPVSEIDEIMGDKATEDDKFNDTYYYYTDDGNIKFSFTSINNYIRNFTIRSPYTATFNRHSIGEAPMLMETYIPRTEYGEAFSNGGAVDIYPYVTGTISKNNIEIIYRYNSDGYTQAFLNRIDIPNGNDRYHLPKQLISIYISAHQVTQALGIQ